VAKSHWGRWSRRLQRSLTTRSGILQAGSLPSTGTYGPGGGELHVGSEGSDMEASPSDSEDDANEELESSGDQFPEETDSFYETESSLSDSHLKEEVLGDPLESQRLIDRDQSKLNGSFITTNLLFFKPKGKRLRKFLKKGQWPSWKKYPIGEYLVPVDRDSFRHATYMAGLIQSMQDIVDSAVFCSEFSFRDQFRDFLKVFLKNIPRKYFFTSSDLRSLRSQIFWTRRQCRKVREYPQGMTASSVRAKPSCSPSGNI
jgi:hypothetical protein